MSSDSIPVFYNVPGYMNSIRAVTQAWFIEDVFEALETATSKKYTAKIRAIFEETKDIVSLIKYSVMLRPDYTIVYNNKLYDRGHSKETFAACIVDKHTENGKLGLYDPEDYDEDVDGDRESLEELVARIEQEIETEGENNIKYWTALKDLQEYNMDNQPTDILDKVYELTVRLTDIRDRREKSEASLDYQGDYQKILEGANSSNTWITRNKLRTLLQSLNEQTHAELMKTIRTKILLS
jgi:hypothetical protein